MKLSNKDVNLLVIRELITSYRLYEDPELEGLILKVCLATNRPLQTFKDLMNIAWLYSPPRCLYPEYLTEKGESE